MTVRRHKRAGLSLLEMLAVMWALAVALGFGMALILAAMRTDQVAAGTLKDLSRRAELADRFRADVARAVAAPDRFAEWNAGPDCLILQTAVDKHVIYQWHNGQLTRIVRTGTTETKGPVAAGAEETRLEFARPAGDRPLLTLRIITDPRPGVTRRSEITAALGGDNR